MAKVFLFTDLESSTTRWEADESSMAGALARHDAIVERALADAGCTWSKHTGDGVCAAFDEPAAALAAVSAIQVATRDDDMLSVRAGLHIGDAEARDGDFFGSTLNRCARLMGTAHGGQTVLSGDLVALVEGTVPLRDLGEHRLRDLGSPMRVYQVGPDEFPPLRSLSSTPTNLPAQRSSFVGRVDEMARLATALESSRLVTLVGVGGTGKTRLALQAAAEASHRFADGTFLVELAPLRDPEGVPRAIAGALGVVDALTEVGTAGFAEAGAAVTDRLATWLASRHVLIVLDNCEHVIAGAARAADRLLGSAPGLVVLATSREPLMIEGEHIFPVPGLAAARQLFADRARSVRPDFELDDRTAPLVEGLCGRLDGIPLAIELAAARLRALSLEQIVQRMDDTFRLLTGGSRTALERHQTLAGTIRWSYDLLDSAEQRLFRELGVFVGGATLDAIESVCSEPDAGDGLLVDLVQQLVDKSLVIFDDGPRGGRYRMLEIVLQYAIARLSESEHADDVRNRHLAWAVALAAPASQNVINVDWAYCDVLTLEHANLDHAFTWAVESRNSHASLSLAVSAASYWRGVGMSARAIGWLSAALDVAPGRDPLLEAIAGMTHVSLRQMGGDYRTAVDDFDAAANRFQDLGEPLGVAYALFSKARALDIIARHEEADLVYDEAAALFDQANDAGGRAWLDLNRGWARFARGDLDGTAALAGRLSESAPEIIGPEPHGAGLVLEGLCRVSRGEVDEGRTRYREGLDVIANQVERAYFGFLCAWVELDGELDVDAGEHLLRQSLEAAQASGAHELLEAQVAWSAVIAARRGKNEVAVELLAAARSIAERSSIRALANFASGAESVRADLLARLTPTETMEVQHRIASWSFSDAADAALAALA